MILTDREIIDALHNEIITINPEPNLLDIQPASVDLLMGAGFKVMDVPKGRYGLERGPYAVDPLTGCWVDKHGNPLKAQKKLEWKTIKDQIILMPGDFALAHTHEWVEIPDFMVGRVEGRSKVARHGAFAHTCAGFIDPGFKGQITLELYNCGKVPLIFRAGQSYCQLVLHLMNFECEIPYGHKSRNSHFQRQTGATPLILGEPQDGRRKD